MNMKLVAEIAKEIGWYPNQAGIAKKLFNQDRRQASGFLKEHSIEHYVIGRTKVYLLPDVIEAIEKTKWKNPKDERWVTP